MPFFVWGILSLWWGSWPRWICLPILLCYVIAHVSVLIISPKRLITVYCFLAFLIPLLSFFLMQPSLNRDWQPDVAVLPYSEINGADVVVHNVRNCAYSTETDFTPRFETRTYDLSKLRSADLILTNWGIKYIAHTMISFGFDGDQYLCFSIETRKEAGESYSALRGFFRQYELTFIAGDERDLLKLRTNYRHGEEVFVYRIHVLSMDRLKNTFLDYLAHINQLHEKAEWYNALSDNCMTGAYKIARKHAAPGRAKWHWSILMNGYADRHFYENGIIDTSLPFADLKRTSHINDRALSAGNALDFSKRIREGLPGMNWVPGKGE